MSPSRRQFLVQASSVLAAAATTSAAEQPPFPSARTRAFMERFGLTSPIVQAGMGGPARPELAIAVSRAGALGMFGLSGASAETARTRVSQVRAGTDRPFAINYLLPRDSSSLPIALDAGTPVVQFAWGIPTKEQVAAIRARNAKFGVQIGSRSGARLALDLGADFLICQGTEAGGHVQGTAPLAQALRDVLEEAGSTPVLAAGGIADGAAIRRWLVAGAAGVLIGTRFVATREAFAHPQYKEAIAGAKAADTVLTVCFQDGWTNAPHRVLRNRTWRMWEAAGCPPEGRRPGEKDVLAKDPNGREWTRYSVQSPAPDMTGQLDEMCLYAGEGVDQIRDIPSAGDVVARLWRDAQTAK